MSEKIVIYSRLRAWWVEGTAGDVIPWLDTDTMSHSILYIRGGNRMALMTIGQVSEMLGVSARMLRYYEKEGLVRSMHRENYAYRVYDEDAVRRIRQIVLLRRLQMPLKRIRVIMDGSAREAAGMVQEQIADMERNLASMGTIRTALERLRGGGFPCGPDLGKGAWGYGGAARSGEIQAERKRPLPGIGEGKTDSDCPSAALHGGFLPIFRRESGGEGGKRHGQVHPRRGALREKAGLPPVWLQPG